MALAGGIRIVVPDRQGYLYEDGGISPADGHSRPFDAAADGSILGQGVGIVVLKRLADAVADGDPIHAVIKGTSINNDGSLKAGYTAPSVAGQSEAVIAAYEDAGVSPETVSYLEAHGSATKLGDPIEVAALTWAYRTRTDKVGFCRIGSVKSNFGHLDRAAGVTGLIKTVLAIENAQIPPSIHYHEPNPEIDFASSPFRVNDTLWEWRSDGAPRRAAVNSLGMGGTNVHVVLEQAPPLDPSGESRPWQLVLLSAKTESALGTATGNLSAFLKAHPDLNLADAAYTLQVGRRDLGYRRMAVCRDRADAAATLEGDPRRLLSAYCEEGQRSVVFMFPGLGGQYVNMARGLYQTEPRLREEVDRCAEILTPYLGCDLREVIYPESAGEEKADETSGERQVDLRQMLRRRDAEDDDPATARLNQTRLTQPALFVVEYALARLWMEWGIRPKALIGYSLGEYVAACLAGVLSLEHALRLVAERARMIGELPGGAMLAVALDEEEVLPLLGEELSLAAVNGPEQSVVAGPPAAIEALERLLVERDVAGRRLQTSHAFHSRMMDPLAEPLAELVAGFELKAPAIPYLSNLTGTWITPEEATDPSYWARHMCQPVRFSDSVAELGSDPQRILFEVGPGQTLATLILQHPASAVEPEPAVLAALRHSYERQPDVAHALNALGKLWLLGVEIDWQGFYRHERRRRVELPTYPFERRRYWIDTVDDGGSPGRRTLSAAADGRSRFYLPSWKRAPLAAPEPTVPKRWLVFVDEVGLGAELVERLRGAGCPVTTVRAGESFGRVGEGSYRLDPCAPHHYTALLAELGEPPQGMVHLWSVGRIPGGGTPAETFRQAQNRGFSSLLALARSLGDGTGTPPLWVISDSLHDLSGQEQLRPEKATVLGACSVLPREHPGLSCRSVDVLLPDGSREVGRLVGQILAEIEAGAEESLVAYRGNHRWVPALELLEDAAPAASEACPARLRQGGVYLVTNALGTPGRSFAEYLLTTVGARLVLVEPPGFPAREKWEEWLLSDGGEGLISRRIRQVNAWEQESAELLVAGVDVADPGRLRELLAEVGQRFGAIHGLIHVAEPAAGAAEGDDGGHLRTAHSLLVLDELLRDQEPDFCFLISPSTAAEGGPTAASAAGGFFMDAFASYGSGVDPGRWTSVTWEMPESADPRAAQQLFSLAPVAQVVVSPRPLDARWNKLEAFREIPPEAPERGEAVGAYPRPSLRVEYVAPRDDTEEKIAELWRELLGVAQVGVHDNFLELGGDSLLASRMVTRMREIFQVDLPIRLLFEASTVAELGRALEEIRREESDREMQEMLEQIKGLSEEELERELLRRAEMMEPGEEAGGELRGASHES